MTAAVETPPWWKAAIAPRSVAIIGASDSPGKVGGRPLHYMQRFGYGGSIFPINPTRTEVQGIKSFAKLADTPVCPELAIIALPATGALSAVQDCAARGVEVAVLLTSGFGETGEEGKVLQSAIVSCARQAGMRLIGPNTQGIANFGNGTIASFATLFSEIAPHDGPVAIVSQSGAMSVVPYAHLRRAGIGVRYAHATGNEADITVADLAACALDDPTIKLLLLYMENIEDATALADVAARAHARNVPVLALKSGRSARGAQAASSHTGALVSEDRVVDAFLRQHGIMRVDDMPGLVNAASLFLSGLRPKGNNLVVVSNSGASCVLAADSAEEQNLNLPLIEGELRDRLSRALPSFATVSNPIDLTGGLLAHSELFGETLDALANGGVADQLFISFPNIGAGYDVDGFVRAATRFTELTGAPVAVATPNPSAATAFKAGGIPAFDHDSHAIAALGQVVRWTSLSAASAMPIGLSPVELPSAFIQGSSEHRYASEWESLAALGELGFPIPRAALCQNIDDARRSLGSLNFPLVAKGCSPEVPHKSEYHLVQLGLRNSEATLMAVSQLMERMESLNIAQKEVILAEMAKFDIELLLGARRDAKFGPVITIGAGGKYVEALDDVAVLIAPFSRDAARDALSSLRIAPLFQALRGEPAIDLEAIIDVMMNFSALMMSTDENIVSVDLNPVLVKRGGGLVIADALIEYGQGRE